MNTGHLLKYSEYFSASIVADVTISLRSGRSTAAFFIRQKRTSVWMVRSCACYTGSQKDAQRWLAMLFVKKQTPARKCADFM